MSERKNKVIQLISFIMHQYYCENKRESLLEILDESFSWIGTEEYEYARGKSNIELMFRRSFEKMPKCTLSDEEYQVTVLEDHVYVCSGKMRVTADFSTGVPVHFYPRVTAVFRFEEDRAICCHMHLSTPYMNSESNEIGVLLHMGPQTSEDLRMTVEELKRNFQKREEELLQICYEDSLTRVYNRNRFDMDMNRGELQEAGQLGIGYFDVNNLKKINDTQGHSAGDQLICRVAEHIRKYFDHKTYRIGGDEFVVIDTERDRENFENVMQALRENMREDGIDCSQGFCWRDEHIHMMEQFNEADQKMYEDKKEYYKQKAKEEN